MSDLYFTKFKIFSFYFDLFALIDKHITFRTPVSVQTVVSTVDKGEEEEKQQQ